MFMLTAPLNTVYAQIEKKFYDTIEFDSGIKLFRDVNFHPEEYVMLKAVVVTVPKAIMQRYDYNGMTMEVQPGDTILMRYDVVFSYKEQPDRSTPIYKNLITYQGEEYWKVDVQKIFGILRDGRMIMVNGYVCCDILEEVREGYKFLVRPDNYKTIQYRDKMRIKYMGKPLLGDLKLSCGPGDVIYCLPGVSQAYEINLKKFYIIKQSHIIGVV